MNISNTHSSTSPNICTEENGIFANLVALLVRLSVCLLVAIRQVAQIQSNRLCSKVSIVKIGGTLVFSSVKFRIQYLRIVIGKIFCCLSYRDRRIRRKREKVNASLYHKTYIVI